MAILGRDEIQPRDKKYIWDIEEKYEESSG